MKGKVIVLYVDNNPRSRKLLAHMLEDCGFEVIARGDPREALELCKIQSFDLALVAYSLPEMTGCELAERIKSQHPDLAVVMISGCACLPSTELLFVDAHFGRGTSFDELFHTLRTLAHANRPAAGNALRSASWAGST